MEKDKLSPQEVYAIKLEALRFARDSAPRPTKTTREFIADADLIFKYLTKRD